MSWVVDEPAFFVLHCVTHSLRGRGAVDETGKETAERVATYQTDYNSR